MKKLIYWFVYAIFLALLVTACFGVVEYVKTVVAEYEDSQPEYVVEKELERIKQAVAKGTPQKIMEFPEISQPFYDEKLDIVSEYLKVVENTKEWSYKIKSGSYSETDQEYAVLADGNMVATITIKSTSSKNALGMLTINDWKAVKDTALISSVGGDYSYLVPDCYRVTVNGEEVNSELPNLTVKREKDTKIYEFTNLYKEPVIEIFDKYGHSMVLDRGVVIPDYTTTIEIPSNFKIVSDCVDFKQHIICMEEDNKYDVLCDYCENIPYYVTYSVEDSLECIKPQIYNNFGEEVEYELVNGHFSNKTLVTKDEVPEYILAEMNPLEYAEEWSIFMTSVNQYGGRFITFDEISKKLIKDSYLYNSAKAWMRSYDATFTSNHTLLDPAFENEKVGNYIEYCKDCFSVDISFGKRLYLNATGATIIDKMNSTFYFHRQKDENGELRWYIIDIREKAN